MKLSELQVGTEYAVVPSWTYGGRGARDIYRVRECDVVKASLVDKSRYEYEPSIRKNDASSFRKADAGNRSVGVIVSATDNSGKTIYWTSRLADIVAPYSILEPKWAQQKSEEELREEQERLKRQRAEQIRTEVINRVATSRTSVINSSKELLGDKCQVEVDSEGYGIDLRAVVKMSLDEYERLMEMAYEGKASVA